MKRNNFLFSDGSSLSLGEFEIHYFYVEFTWSDSLMFILRMSSSSIIQFSFKCSDKISSKSFVPKTFKINLKFVLFARLTTAWRSPTTSSSFSSSDTLSSTAFTWSAVSSNTSSGSGKWLMILYFRTYLDHSSCYTFFYLVGAVFYLKISVIELIYFTYSKD